MIIATFKQNKRITKPIMVLVTTVLNESILVNQGLDVVSVAKRLGHLPSTATNYYLDQIPEEDKKASEILQNLF